MKNTRKSILKNWRDIVSGDNQFSRAMLIAQIMDNNLQIYKMVKGQINFIERYRDKLDDVVEVDEFMHGCEELLNLCGLTSSTFGDDKKGGKTGRKS